ncbi:MAG: hypothetical protein JEZ07_03120 [Phycisphaerae bacterium]|nr:hypothetical protein [Phycisphaerae bacterium]
MNFYNVLAEAAQSTAGAAETNPSPDISAQELWDQFWTQITNFSWREGMICLVFASIYLFYGWRLFKVLVVINFALIGLLIGKFAGQQAGSPMWGGILGTVAAALLAWPFMKVGVALLGATAGAILGAALWWATPLNNDLCWSGALAGFVAGGLLAFSSYKVSIMLFTSLQGAVFLASGMLILLYDCPNLTSFISNSVNKHVFIVPAMVIVPTFFGVMFQKKLIAMESKWTMPDNEGWGRK